jgi:hypothetical protein
MVPLQQHVAFDGGVAAAVEDLAADDVNDGTHVFSNRVQTGAATPSTSDHVEVSDTRRAHAGGAYCSAS